MNEETIELISERIDTRKKARRDFLTTAGVAVAGVAAATLLTQTDANAQRGGLDPAVLNFALNLEYLEAEYYLLGVNGTGLVAGQIEGTGTQGATVARANPKVTFATPLVEAYAKEIAADELAHVLFLRSVLGASAVAKPAIDLLSSFKAVVADFDPFFNENHFVLGAFVFEDVGVTAYKGAAPLLSNRGILEAAAGILAVEAYHAGEIRSLLAARGDLTVRPNGTTSAPVRIFDAVQVISDARDSVNPGVDKDQGIGNSAATANIVPVDSNSIAYSRSTREVLNIVYLATGTPTSGGFFPNGLNGAIR